MTIEIEAGASQSQFSMKTLAVHAFFGGLPWDGRLPTTDADLGAAEAIREKSNSFSKETPSLSLRLRSVRIFRELANVARTKSNKSRVCSTSVRDCSDANV
jgi:hypothetical protein